MKEKKKLVMENSLESKGSLYVIRSVAMNRKIQSNCNPKNK